MPPLYATTADLEANVEGWVTDSQAAADRLLERAELDLDALFPYLPTILTGTYAGRRIDPTRLAAYELKALRRAVALQAYHRLGMTDANGDAVTRAKRTKGPDFEVELADSEVAGTGRYHPDLDVALAPLSRIRLTTARLRGR